MVADDKEIVLNNITKKYGDVTALDELNLEVERGSLFGLLGPNGAGKTTAINVLCGLTAPDSGSASICGQDTTKETVKIKQIIGVCPQSPAIYGYLTGMENVELFGELQGMERKDCRESARVLLDKMGLLRDARRRAGGYSEGMKRRLSLAMALVHDPEIAFLDEPSVAMDPQSRRAVWAYLKDLKDKKKTIVLSTHYMEEAERLCDVVGIIDHGKLIALGSPKELISRYGKRDLEEVFIHLTGRTIREDI